MMKERPILMSTPMVQATLEDLKTQTRRIVKPSKKGDSVYFSPDNKVMMEFRDLLGGYQLKCPYGQAGDLLWGRETWCVMDGEYFYKASVKHPKTLSWKPSIFMPKAAARIWLRLKDVRVERVKEITGEDAMREGIGRVPHHKTGKLFYKDYSYYTDKPVTVNGGTYDPRISFMTLWNSINGRTSWYDNPWVWVLEFERIEAPENRVYENELGDGVNMSK